ncbi:FO synthase subunit 1 [Durusdinium trenchii]|uniref:FO synthase subunit 1 n=1 Tax=Durusdinium trenchii TaxID=1381693 RepID=A0ABP0KA55_9DINO
MIGFDTEARPGASQRTEQKGVPAHLEVITTYLRGMKFEENDLVVFADILPNRQAEFARAAVSRALDANARRPQVRYCGCFRADQKDVIANLEEMVYTHWDASDAAPPRARPTERVPDPTLVLLSWNCGVASFPDSITQKFPEHSAAYGQVLEMKKQLCQEFPDSVPARTTQSAPKPGKPRAAGRPGFNIEGGKTPLDVTRLIDLEHTPVASFNVGRKAYCPGTRVKPAIVVGTDYSMWIGNETDEEVSLQACEICGFNLG